MAERVEATSDWSGRFRTALQPKVLVPSITAGLIAGLLVIIVVISFAALIFSGDLSGHLSRGIGLALYGGLAIGLVIVLTSSFPGTVAVPQDSPAAILALMASAIAAGMAGSAASEGIFLTVLVAIGVTSLLTGALCLALGWFKLGGLIRYIPYPVIGGFLAGTGWLLVRGTMGLLTDLSFSLSQLPSLFQPDLLIRWLPALVFAVVLMIILRRHSHFLIIPGTLLAAIASFFMLLWLTGTSLAEATAQGWLLGPFPEGALWRPLSPSALGQVYWPAILAQAGNIGTILIISVISLLLNTSGLELTVRRDIDLNRELQSAGWANLIAGLGAGLPGYQTLALSVLGPRMGGNSRLVGIIAALLCGVLLFFGASLLSFFPKPVLGGLLLFLGLAFVVEWVYDAWFKMPKAEYAIVLLILIAMNTLGVLPGVGLGVVFAVVLFVVSYSRISVVQHTLSGTSYRSNVDRPQQASELLRSRGQWLYILELQGFVFFGTANVLFDQVRERASSLDLPSPRFIVLDFRRVRGLDASAVLSFAKMVQLAQAQGFVLVFTDLSPRVEQQLAQEVLGDEDRAAWHIDLDLDHGVEWCEEQILRIARDEEMMTEPAVAELPRVGAPSLPSRLAGLLASVTARVPGQAKAGAPESLAVTRLGEYMERKDIPVGYLLIQQGDPPKGLYFIERGQVTAQLECVDGRIIRLRKMGSGTIVGEMGLYLGTVASASVVAEQPTVVHYLSAKNLGRMEANEPELAAALHKYIAQLLGERLARANDTLQALFEGPELPPAGRPVVDGLRRGADQA